MEEILEFLTALKENNNREWFQTHKEKYQSARKTYVDFVGTLIKHLSIIDKQVLDLEAKDSVFRIYRDVRFSNNKTPYKTAFGAYMAKGGRKSKYAGYYLHLEPGNSFLGGGLHLPPSDILKKVREAIYEEPEKYLEIIHNEDFKKTFGEPQGESLKIGPKGFPKDFEHINLIKLKSYTLMFPLSDQEIKNPNLLEHILPVFEKMKAMNSFLNMAVDY